jgi:glycosyltransferase involved in cell wall biosynthesis
VRPTYTVECIADGNTSMNSKVLIIVENLPVPFDKRVWKEALALSENGYAVTVLCPRAKGYTPYEFKNGIHIYRHPTPKEGNSALGYLWEYGCVLCWEFIYALWIYLRRGFDVIQGCNPPDFIFLIALPFKLFGVKYIFDQHDVCPELYLSKYGKKGLLYRLQLWLEKITYRMSDVVMATNRSYKDLAVSRGSCAPEKVFIVRNGPSLKSFTSVDANTSLKHGKRHLVGYVGNMGPQEGLDILIDVARRAKSLGRRDVHFTCVGGGPALESLRKMAQDKHLADTINFTGRIPDEQLLAILSTADVCVNPDRPCVMNDISTMIKVMEYMALAKPIVQFDLKEGRFSAGDASLYADTQNTVEDFTAKILWLLDHPDERRRMGEFGRRRIEQELAWKYSVHNLLAAYSRALKNEKRMLNQSVSAPNPSAQKEVSAQTLCAPSIESQRGGMFTPLANPGANEVVFERFRCPMSSVDFGLEGSLNSEAGFFRFGPGITCYGRATRRAAKQSDYDKLPDMSALVGLRGPLGLLPFDPEEVITNLRQERYVAANRANGWHRQLARLQNQLYYLIRPVLGVAVRKHLQKISLRGWSNIPFPRWPVDTTVEDLLERFLLSALASQGISEIPFIWFWPDGASSCAIMTHDVETKAGADWCSQLMDMDDAFGIKASFQIVPERRYPVNRPWLESFRERGFEINIQDLNHDGRLFRDRNTFLHRAEAINKYAAEYGSRGFRSAALYRNPEWYDSLDLSYDMSIPNVAHLEPQRGGCCTVFPYLIGKILEIPLTTTQDYSLFHILNEHSIELWQQQMEIIQRKHGLISFIIHPDYVIAKKARRAYAALLEHLVRFRSERGAWFALPSEVDRWWRARANMHLAFKGDKWIVEGLGSEHAKVAFARLTGGQLTYTIPRESISSSLSKFEPLVLS